MMKRVDLHIHTIYSDGTDTLQSLLTKIKENEIDFFSITDHDEIRGSEKMIMHLREIGDENNKADEPVFIPGVEFSCNDEYGDYHILGYGYDPESWPIRDMVRIFHDIRMQKFENRMKFFKQKFDVPFTDEEIDKLRHLNNPGKPHISRLFMKYGYADSVTEAIKKYINKYHDTERKIRPEEAIEAIIKSGGIPVLAHGVFGNGDQFIGPADMDARVKRLTGFGLMGLECYYSRYKSQDRELVLRLANKYDLLATAGSDYHGENKSVKLGCTGLEDKEDVTVYLKDFMREVSRRTISR